MYLVQKKTTKDLFALKIIDCSNRNIEEYLETLKSEKKIFEILDGEFVTKAYYSFTH